MANPIYDFSYQNSPKSIAWSQGLTTLENLPFTLRPVPGNASSDHVGSQTFTLRVSSALEAALGGIANIYA